MRAYKSDEDLVCSVGDLRYKPKVVPPDVEHGPRPDRIGVGEVAADVDEMLPLGAGSHLEPGSERYLGLRMPFPELLEALPGDDPHCSMFAYREPLRSSDIHSGTEGRKHRLALDRAAARRRCAFTAAFLFAIGLAKFSSRRFEATDAQRPAS